MVGDMDSRLLSSLGKAAGLGGIALGVFLLLFQGVLQTKFLPQAGLNSAEAFAVILSLMILTFGVAGTGVLGWLISRTTSPEAPLTASTLGVLAGLIALVICAAVYVGAQAKPDTSTSIAPITVSGPPQMDELYVHSRGRFGRVGNEWTEYNLDWRPMYQYTQFERTADNVVIYDKTRDTYIRIPTSGGLSYASRGLPAQWEPLYVVARQ